LSICFYHTNLAFEYPFTISKGTKTHQEALVLAFEKDGIVGYGEAPAIRYYNISVQQMMNDIKSVAHRFNEIDFNSSNNWWAFLKNLLPNNSFALCALDMALYDWKAKSEKKKLFETFQTEWKNIPPTDYTLGIDSIEILKQKIQQHPFPIYKIKLGLGDEENILKAIRDISSSKIRVDFNEGIDEKRFFELLPLLENSDVELIEQPLSKYDEIGMKNIFAKTSIDLFADEFCVNENDVEKCVGKFHGINIKLTKCGGITPALRMIEKARELNLKVMMGSMNESTIGTAAIAHFLPMLDKVDMDGILLLKEDIATGISFNANAECLESKGFGLGVEINQEKLNQFLQKK
jgi:L-alanine-DL-glutamate epimerase-like enolase superfamily enzyme